MVSQPPEDRSPSNRNHQARRATAFAIAMIGMVAIVAALGGLLYWVLDAHQTATPQRKDYLARLAFFLAGVLLVSLLLLAAMVIRRLSQRLAERNQPFRPMGYVDAWTEAGRRLKAEDAPPIEGFETDEKQEDSGDENEGEKEDE